MTDTQFADPPGMPEDERMTRAELRVVREALGLTGDWLAAHLGVSPRTVRHWEAGRYAIPDGVRLELERMEAVAAGVVEEGVKRLRDAPEPTLAVYASDEDVRAAHADSPWPAAWHRAVAYRIALEVPGLSIVYTADIDPGD